MRRSFGRATWIRPRSGSSAGTIRSCSRFWSRCRIAEPAHCRIVPVNTAFKQAPCSGEYRADEPQHHAVKLLRPLERCKVAHVRQHDVLCSGNTPGKILGMLGLDELVMLALDDRNRHPNRGEIAGRIV